MNAYRWLFLPMLLMLISFPVAGQDKGKDKDKKVVKKQAIWTDPAEAPIDYKIQGEYANDKDKLFVQVVARGNGKFDVYFLEGGLPGAGWDPKSKKIKIEAKLDLTKEIATFSGPAAGGAFEGAIDPKAKMLTLTYKNGKTYTAPRVERKSPTLGAKAPEGAIILFDGTNTDAWKNGKLVGNLLGVPADSKQSFTNFKLHVEFRTPFMPNAGGQGRGNSGVYVCGREVQVLDSFGLKGDRGECGGLYGQRDCDVNMCLPPLVWQTFDIEHRPGKLDPDTKKQGSPTVTVRHNGIIIHENVELKGGASKGPIHLQNHGNPVVYRNIWVVELK